MKASNVRDRLQAWKEGRPVRVSQALPWSRSPDSERLVMAFVRMSGESLPWGVAVGSPGKEPAVFTCPEPRNADELARVARKLWAHLRNHMAFPMGPAQQQPLDDEQVDDLKSQVRMRQLWLPGPSHVSMLHFLDYRYTPARTGPAEQLEPLKALGRASGWLFRESTRPGQVRVLDATRALRRSFAFPSEDVRQSHLGFLLAWLTTDGDRDTRIAAARVAEKQSVGITMDPELERDRLAPLVEAWNAAKASPAQAEKIAADIDDVLRPELIRRWEQTVQALAAFDEDGREPNTQLGKLETLGADEFYFQYWRREVAAPDQINQGATVQFHNNPETDFHPPAAAARYFAHLHASELTLSELVHGDPELVDDALAEGNAISGEIVSVVDEGTSRTSIPVWTVHAPAEGLLKLREGSGVCVVGLRGRAGSIRSIEIVKGIRILTIEITLWKRARKDVGAPAANDDSLEGTAVVLLSTSMVGLSLMKSYRVWNGDGPGAWLPHAAPLPHTSPSKGKPGDLVKLVEKLGRSG
jgi:hypothetical protein